MPDTGGSGRYLLCRTGRGVAAIPLGHVREAFRPLPVAPLGGLPPFVCGLAVIRGLPTPVVDLARLLRTSEAAATGQSSRFVSLALGDRAVALAVDAVIDVRALPNSMLAEIPRLLSDAAGECVSAVGALDAELLLVLEASLLIPHSTWAALAAAGVSA